MEIYQFCLDRDYWLRLDEHESVERELDDIHGLVVGLRKMGD